MSINKIIIENFKIFEGQHIFDLNDLNIFTGANNSGKSTLFKAISLFAKGLEKGDFPSIDLFDNNAGEFGNLVNWNSGAKSFKIGFFIELGIEKTPFKVLYEFVDGKGSYYSEGMAQFLNFEIKDLSDNLIFGTYNVERYKVTSDNIEYNIDDNLMTTFDSSYPFKSPMDENNPAELFVKFNLSTLKYFIKIFSTSDYSLLLAQMQKLKGNNNNWWGEHFMEENISDLSVDIFSLEDLLRDIYKDDFRNLGNYDIKNILLLGGEDDDVVWDEYLKLRKDTKYSEFIEEIIQPLFTSIEKGLVFFRKENFSHIVFQNFTDRLIHKNSSTQYLFALLQDRYNSDMFNEFVRESLKIFNIDGYIEFRSHFNNALEARLVTELEKTNHILEEEKKLWLKKNKLEHYDDGNLMFDYYPGEPISSGFKRYSNNPKQSITDLGKGTANLIGLILKTYSILVEQKKRKKMDEEVRESLGYEPIKILDKFILVEEPEVFLHPDWQSKLADFFVHCNKYGKSFGLKHRRFKVVFLIETHSVYLIQRLQFLVARNDIEPKDLNIIFFNTDEKEEKFYKMKMREDGIFVNKFGTGFYDETSKLTLNILNPDNKN